MLWYDFRQVWQHHYTQIFLSLKFAVPHLSSRLSSVILSGCKKNTHSCEILLLKIQQVICLTFSCYSINILLNYLNFMNLAHFSISRNLFLVVWYSDSKTTEYSLLFVFLGKSSLFQDLQYWGSFLCVSLLLPIDNNSKTIAVISGIYLSVINWVLLLWVWKSTEYSVLFLYPWNIFFSGLFR